MTFEEAKKILEKEGFFLVKVSKGFEFSELPVWEKQEVVEAKRVVYENDFATAMGENEWFYRQERLQKEYEQNTKAPGSGEEQPNESNPALKESASQFNDALLDEQAKKIAELTKDKELMKKATLSQLDDFIEIYNLLTKESQKTKRLGKEIARLNGIIHDKNAVLSDVAEELRLSKIREKNLVEVSQKYMKENEELKKELADKHPDKKFSDQMVGVDKAEEGGDHSAKVVLCGKDVVKKFKENEESVFDFFKRHKETAEELYEVADEAFEQLLLFGEVIIKSDK